MDFFCLSPNGIRVGYPSATLLRGQSRAHRAACATGRAVLVLTANRRYAVRGVRPGTRLAAVARRLHLGAPFHVGRNDWYFFSRGGANGHAQGRGTAGSRKSVWSTGHSRPVARASGDSFAASY